MSSGCPTGMTTPSHFEPVGHIAKAHGLDGLVVFQPELSDTDQLLEIPVFYVSDNRGFMIPHRVEEFLPIDKKGHISFFVKFEHVDERTQAELLKGKSVYVNTLMNPLNEPDDAFSMEEVIGFTVVDETDAELGTVTGLISHPGQDVLETELFEGSKTILIPVVEAYVEEIDDESETVYVHNIQPLMEL